MASKVDDRRNGCTFLWKIENISHCWLSKRCSIQSPVFNANALGDTKWCLRLYPMDDNFGLYLCCCESPNTFHVNYQLAFLDKDGEFMTERYLMNADFKKDTSFTSNKMLTREKVFIAERKLFLPEDTLTVHCSIWKLGEELVKPEHLSARTVFKVNRRSFVWQIDEFSSLKPGVRNKFKDDLIDFDLVLNKIQDFGEKMEIDIISFPSNLKYFSLKTSLITSEGETEECGGHESCVTDLKKGILYTLFFTKKLMENKSRYLPNDVLSLDCEYISANGSSHHEMSYGMISPKVTNMAVGKRIDNCIIKENPQHSPFLVNDLKSIYDDELFSDTKLRTSTKTFPAHKLILSARSPVFRRMFSNDMKENNNGHINIDDLEDDTVCRMLLYMYADSLEDLKLENACKLYVAADKYEILSLRSSCSSFLKDNLCPNKACDILVLADRHQDEGLKSAVQDFILRHDEVFGLQEWKDLMATNLQLAADIMYRKIYQG